MGQITIVDKLGTQRILSYVHNIDLNLLIKISKWYDRTKKWIGWYFLTVPPYLEADLSNFQTLLHGASPLQKYSKDSFRWDPSSSAYTIKAAYGQLSQDLSPSPLWKIWKLVWKSEAIQKIKVFIWTLLKGKIITS